MPLIRDGAATLWAVDDERILARLDDEPEAYAELFRRHVDDVLACSADPAVAAEACAEAFATVLDGARRFDPGRGTAAAWLQALARREVARGQVGDRARRRLGMAPLEPGEAFADQLEEELVAAARYRAEQRARPDAARAARRPAPPDGGRRARRRAGGARGRGARARRRRR